MTGPNAAGSPLSATGQPPIVSSHWTVRPGAASEIADVAEQLTASMSLGRRQLALSQLAAALRRAGPAGVFFAVAQQPPDASDAARHGAPAAMLAAAMATRSAADAALLVAAGHLGQPDVFPGASAPLVAASEAMEAQLAAQGVRFIQATWESDDDRPPFAALGYRKIAQLDYLSATLQTLLIATQRMSEACSSGGFRVQALDPTSSAEHRRQWVALVEQTFQETLDCPLLSDYRTAADVVASYIQSPTFDPTAWHLIHDGDQAVGCLILTPHQGGAVLELTYMGVLPERRGRRWGARLLGEVARMAAARGAAELMLAVDQQNHPAARLYRRAGMEVVASEAVWGRRLAISSAC